MSIRRKDAPARCKNASRYKGKRRPTCGCWACWKKWRDALERNDLYLLGYYEGIQAGQRIGYKEGYEDGLDAGYYLAEGEDES